MEKFSVDTIFQLFSVTRFNFCEGIFIVFSQWIIHDNRVRKEYHQAVGEAIDNILRQIHTGKITLEMGAQDAHQMRNRFFHLMRYNTSPIGLLIAHSIHATTRPYTYYLEKKSLSAFGKPSKDLSLDQAREVIMSTLISARRPSRAVTDMSKRASLFCKGAIITIAAKSLYLASFSSTKAIDIARLVVWGSSLVMAGRFGISITNKYISWRNSGRHRARSDELLSYNLND
ncbi:hypothetical protein GGI42DRAFT_279 [Trichoderma sp. SZMC 28013]